MLVVALTCFLYLKFFQGVGADGPVPQSNHHYSPGKIKRGPAIPVPDALKQTKFPSGLHSLFSTPTEKPARHAFKGDYGLKPPSHIYSGFSEYVDPEVVRYSPTASPFSSLIKVPHALNLHGGYSPTTRPQPAPSRSQVLAFKIPPAIIQTESPQHKYHHHHNHHHGRIVCSHRSS